MNYGKLTLATLVGAIVNFLAGWALYGLLLKGAMENGLTEVAKAAMKPEEQHNIVFYFLGGIFFSLMLAYIFEKWANIRTFQTGAMAGAIISLLTSLYLDCGFLASMNMYSSNSIIAINAVASAILGGITGAAVGWMLGFNRN